MEYLQTELYTKYNHIIKLYNVKDGTGLPLLKRENIKLICLSEYKFNDSQKKYFGTFNFDYIYFGVKDKRSKNMQRDGLLSECAFIGDDINDIELLRHVKINVCPNDAVNEVKKVVHKISKAGAKVSKGVL